MSKPKPLKPVVLVGGFKLIFSFGSLAGDTLKPKNCLNGVARGTLKSKHRLFGIASSARGSLTAFVGSLLSTLANVGHLIGTAMYSFTQAGLVRRLALLLSIMLISAAAYSTFITPQMPSATINSTLNFQARLEKPPPPTPPHPNSNLPS